MLSVAFFDLEVVVVAAAVVAGVAVAAQHAPSKSANRILKQVLSCLPGRR